jgi:hypothetical protein
MTMEPDYRPAPLAPAEGPGQPPAVRLPSSAQRSGKVDDRPPIARRMQTTSWATFLLGAGLISILGNGADNEEAWYGLMAGASMGLYVLGGLTYRYRFGGTIAVFAAVVLLASMVSVLGLDIDEEVLWPILLMTGGGVLLAKAAAAKYD